MTSRTPKLSVSRSARARHPLNFTYAFHICRSSILHLHCLYPVYPYPLPRRRVPRLPHDLGINLAWTHPGIDEMGGVKFYPPPEKTASLRSAVFYQVKMSNVEQEMDERAFEMLWQKEMTIEEGDYT